MKKLVDHNMDTVVLAGDSEGLMHCNSSGLENILQESENQAGKEY